MGFHKSLIPGILQRMYLEVYCDLYADIAERFLVSSTESRLDTAKIRSRVASEGIQFLTVSLPKLGKAIDMALSKNMPLLVDGFQKKPKTAIPKLFGSLLSRVFTDSGLERPDADPVVLRALRQLVYFLYKLEIPYDEIKTQKVIDLFIQTDAELKELRIPDSNITKHARWFTTDVFGLFDPRSILPRHGPGAVATGEKACQKHKFSRIYKSIEMMYPFTEYFQFSMMQVVDDYQAYADLEVLETGTAKVVLVPKDSRGPRLISCEPLEYQWIQQGLGRKLASHLEAHRFTKGHVNFTCQNVNRELALESSLTQEWVTLDMKEASDRVSLELVKELFRDVPDLLDALTATRTSATKLPDGSEVQLNKFAPMGSCLCFPVEAFVFYALAVSAIMNDYGWSRSDARRAVYVYGDDIIVRREVYPCLLQRLPEFGLMLNDGKCCTAGSFRESCGCDAYKGVDVTPIKLRSVWYPRRRIDIGVLSSYVALSNAAYKNGYMRVASRIESLVTKVTGPLPVFSNENIGGLGFVRPDACTHVQAKGVRTRWNNELHRREVWTCQVRPVYSYADPDDWSTVLRRFTTPDQYTIPGTYAIPHRSRPKWGWTHLP
jgi:hypothetical protein